VYSKPDFLVVAMADHLAKISLVAATRIVV
jgi:hypothetical protein